MCCFAFPVSRRFLGIFSRPVHVHDTRIFARLDGPTQLLAYDMQLAAAGDGAMILPIAVRPGTQEHELEFIDLSAIPDLFDLLGSAFDVPSRKGGPSTPTLSRPRLRVQQVGAFAASFVPTVADFDRLDPRFRLPDAVWSQLPVQDFGFAVFKLRVTGSAATKVHPMAFRFPTRDPTRLFFPTLHVHDGQVHRTARFDHALYHQGAATDADPAWSTHLVRAASERSGGLVDPELPLARTFLTGKRINADTWMPASTP